MASLSCFSPLPLSGLKMRLAAVEENGDEVVNKEGDSEIGGMVESI